jgi:AAA+ ATPase superfamily predicted ATPase
MFINRETELDQLEKRFVSEKAELFVLYGRRRVGKTELLRTFCEGKSHIYFVATFSSDRDQLMAFSQAVWGFSHTDVPEGFTYPSWDAAFRELAELPGRPVVVLDEFTYLIGGNKAIPSILQKAWDERLQHTQVFLVLCGSYIGMMEKEVLGYQAALYGRRTGNILLQPLSLPAAGLFFPAFSPLQIIEAWAVLGGMPYYLLAFAEADDLFSNISQIVLHPQGLLYNEPRLLLMEELREPRNYFSILRAVAQGRTRLNEIAQAAQVGTAVTTNRYLDILQQMQIITRTVPVTEKRPDKSRKGVYRITDHFLRFWFRYVHPHQSSLDLGLANEVMANQIQPTFGQFVSYAFEEACRNYVAQLARMGKLPFVPERIGSWWDREAEVDVVALNESDNTLLVGECKWSNKLVGTNVLDDLKRNATSLLKIGSWERVFYVLFAKVGYTETMSVLAQEEGLILVEGAELVS